MDIVISKKNKKYSKKYIVASLLLLPLFFVVNYLWFLGQSDFSFNRKSMVFGEVKQDKFTVSVRGTGVLVPDSIQWLSANVEAKVEKLVVKAGNVVSQGDLIVSLSNPQLVQKLSEARWELEAMEAELKAAKVARESTFQEQKSIVLNTKMDYESSLLEFNAHEKLIGTGAVSQLAYDRSRLAKSHFEKRLLASEQELARMEDNLQAQNNAQTARVNKAKKILERIQQQVDDLQVKATMDSIVLETPLEEGQRILMGANIAKLAQQESLIAELQIPEIQIRGVAVGQQAIIDTRNNKIAGVVSRIDPAVINGNVQVDITFVESLPDDARPDLSVDGEIKIIEIDDTLFVERPLFAQSRSDSAFYKLSDDGSLAERVNVKVGYGSVNEIQILEGLQVGDKIVISDPTRFETYERFRIN